MLISSYKLINAELKADYEPFGKVNILVERIENNFRFPGQYYIKETGLYYNWWRWYKSETGRYMEVDPRTKIYLGETIRYIPSGVIGEREYNYAKNNPIFYIDVSGLACAPRPCKPPEKYPECNAKCQERYEKGLICCEVNYPIASIDRSDCILNWKRWLENCTAFASPDCGK